MLARCYNPNSKSYKDYGAKGTSVCDEWRQDPQTFIKWAMTAGWNEGLAVDKDIKIPGNKVYSPDTCTLVTQEVNNRASHTREIAYGKSKHVLLSSTHLTEILDKYAKSNVSQYELGKLYGVSRSAIQKIVNSAGIQRGSGCP